MASDVKVALILEHRAPLTVGSTSAPTVVEFVADHLVREARALADALQDDCDDPRAAAEMAEADRIERLVSLLVYRGRRP